MQEIVLSICIPTFNRVGYLRELLPLLVREVSSVNQNGPLVEIVISDNASDDDTQTFCNCFLSPDLSYERNDKNVGGDRNFLICVSRARGRYVWLFGDDELLQEGGVARVVALLTRTAPALLILKGDAGLADSIYSDYRECLMSEMRRCTLFPLAHTLITSNVFSRELFDLKYAESMLKTNYAHMYGFMSRLRCGGTVAVLSGVIFVRPSRAQFDHWPFALCVKQGFYLFSLGRWFHAPTLYRKAVRVAANLPIEWAACLLHKCFPKIGRT